ALHPRRSARLTSRAATLGWMGELHPDLIAALDCREPLVGAELDIAGMMQVSDHPPGESRTDAASRTPSFTPPSVFPPARRDLSIVIAESIPYESVLKIIRDAADAILEACALIDLYRGATIGAQ